MKYFVGIVIILAIIAQTDIIKSFLGDAGASLATFKQLADLYNNVEPKEQWNKEKCDKVEVIVSSYCVDVCRESSEDNCDVACRSDFETEFQCDQFK